MNTKRLKNALPWLILVLLLPLLALSSTSGTVEAGCPCQDNPSPPPPPVTEVVRVDVSPHGAGDVEVAGRLPDAYPVTRTVETSQSVYLEAFPADGYYFVGWSGDLSGNANPAEADIDGDAEITAHFFPEEIVSADSRLQIVFPVGTVVQDRDGAPLGGLEIAISETPLPPPPESDIVGRPYELGPDGTTFDRPVTINFSYDHGDIRPGVDEEELVLGYYDNEAAQWQFMPSVVDMASHIVTSMVDHLSTFAVIAPMPLPAAFSTSELSVYPPEAEIGETVTVSVLVTNSGELEGVYGLSLTINGVVEGTREITLAGGSQQVVFSVAGDEAGTYSVEVNGLEGSFTVREAPILPIVLPSAVIWTILGLAIAALVFSAVIFPIVWMRRDYY
ncbi:MAG: hypothetical protein MUO17_01680 [Dehalococcoidales bacterium]|nr:hypothetical protein [Dehalococcoidales bacterium]